MENSHTQNLLKFRSRGPPARSEDDPRHALNIGLIVPFSNFLKKSYEKSVGAAVGNVKKKGYSWSDVYYLDEDTIHIEMMSINPSPTGDFRYRSEHQNFAAQSLFPAPPSSELKIQRKTNNLKYRKVISF